MSGSNLAICSQGKDAYTKKFLSISLPGTYQKEMYTEFHCSVFVISGNLELCKYAFIGEDQPINHNIWM